MHTKMLRSLNMCTQNPATTNRTYGNSALRCQTSQNVIHCTQSTAHSILFVFLEMRPIFVSRRRYKNEVPSWCIRLRKFYKLEL